MLEFGICNVVFLGLHIAVLYYIASRYIQNFVKQKYENILFSYYVNVNYNKILVLLNLFFTSFIVIFAEMLFIKKYIKIDVGRLFYLYLISHFIVDIFLVEIPDIIFHFKNKKVQELIDESNDDFEDSMENKKFLHKLDSNFITIFIGAIIILVVVYVCGHFYVAKTNDLKAFTFNKLEISELNTDENISASENSEKDGTLE